MDQGIAKGDITLSDGTGTDNMTCIIIQIRDPNAAKITEPNSAGLPKKLEESKQQF